MPVQGYALPGLYAYVGIASPAVLVVYRFEYEAVYERLMQRTKKVYRGEGIDQQLVKNGYAAVLLEQLCNFFLCLTQHCHDDDLLRTDTLPVVSVIYCYGLCNK